MINEIDWHNRRILARLSGGDGKICVQFDQYLVQHIERLRQDNDSSSILSDVIHNGDLTEVEIRTLAGLLLGAGFITTAHTFGKVVVALVRHREQLASTARESRRMAQRDRGDFAL